MLVDSVLVSKLRCATLSQEVRKLLDKLSRI
jgi:hypothetical protein